MRIRPFDPATDTNFTLHSFMKSFVIPRLSLVDNAPLICRLDRDTISNYWHDWMEGVLSRGESLIACDTEEPFFILGWLARHGSLLAYMYTRELHRNRGVAKSLLKEAKIDPKKAEWMAMTPQFRKYFLDG